MIRALSATLAANRVLFGIGYLIWPDRVGSGWIGRSARRPQTRVLTRALGARDLVLGLGALAALRNGGAAARPWPPATSERSARSSRLSALCDGTLFVRADGAQEIVSFATHREAAHRKWESQSSPVRTRGSVSPRPLPWRRRGSMSVSPGIATRMGLRRPPRRSSRRAGPRALGDLISSSSAMSSR